MTNPIEPTPGEQARARALFASLDRPEAVTRLAAELLTSGIGALTAAYQAGDINRVVAELRWTNARAAAYEERISALDVQPEPAAPEDGVCRMCTHSAVAHGPDGCMVVGCTVGVELAACPVTDREFGLTAAEFAADRAAEQRDPLDDADIRCGTCLRSTLARRGKHSCTCTRTIPVPTVRTDENGVVRCGDCGHMGLIHGRRGCGSCPCEFTSGDLSLARQTPAPADTDGGQQQ